MRSLKSIGVILCAAELFLTCSASAQMSKPNAHEAAIIAHITENVRQRHTPPYNPRTGQVQGGRAESRAAADAIFNGMIISDFRRYREIIDRFCMTSFDGAPNKFISPQVCREFKRWQRVKREPTVITIHFEP